jgi:protein TonB
VGRDSSDIWSEPTPPPAEKTERAPEKEDENPAAELFQLEMYRDSGRQLVQNRLAWVLAGAFGTLLLVGSFSYFRDSQQEDIGPQEDGVIYQQPASAIIPPATTNQPEKVEQSAPAPLKPPVTDPGPKSQITISAPVSAGPNPAAPKPEAGLAREAPVVNRVPKFQSVTSEPTPAISNPVPKSEFANSAPPATVKNPVLDPESTSSTVTPPSPAESRPPSEKLSRTAVPRRRSVTIGPIPEGIPRIAETPQPGFRYPVVSNRALRGKVSLKAMVGIDGSVKQLSVLDGNPALVAAAVRAVRHWRYRPYEIAGQAIEVQTNVTFNFLGHDVVTISFPAEP